MDILTITRLVAVKITPAGVVGIVLLSYMKQKLKDKADRQEVIDMEEKIENKLTMMKNEVINVIKDKLDDSLALVSLTIEKLELVFDERTKQIRGILDTKIKALQKQVDRLDDK